VIISNVQNPNAATRYVMYMSEKKIENEIEKFMLCISTAR